MSSPLEFNESCIFSLYSLLNILINLIISCLHLAAIGFLFLVTFSMIISKGDSQANFFFTMWRQLVFWDLILRLAKDCARPLVEPFDFVFWRHSSIGSAKYVLIELRSNCFSLTTALNATRI